MNNLSKIRKIMLPLFAVAIILSGCNSCGYDSKKITETATSGNIKIAVDEAYQLLMDTEIYTFEAFYKYAKITPLNKPEGEAFDLFMKDSVRCIIASRKLTDAEDQQLRNNQFIPKTTKIAYDALVFIVNNDNNDSLLTFNQIKDIFTGKISKWSDINKNSALGNLNVVFDNNKSCNTRYIREKFELKDNFPANCFAVKSNPEVINYVEKNKNAIGIISVNWISDKDDTISNGFLHRIRVVSVGDESNTDGKGEFYKPFQGNIAEGSYPLTREVYMINRETFTGLGTGFVSFVAGEKGQRIILKSGLVPATMPIRLVEIKK
jgi:phosphate transport system substrate-binding protein